MNNLGMIEEIIGVLLTIGLPSGPNK